MTQSPSNAGAELPAEQDSDGAEPDLRVELFDLEGMARGDHGLESLLERVATFATDVIPGADGASVTLMSQDRPDGPIEMFGASNELIAEIDRIQYEIVDEGPCITAARERRTVRSGSLGGESQWPRFGPRVSRLGIHSTLAVPLLLPTRVIGTINVYARAKNAFNDHAVALGTQFAQPAAVAVQNAQLLARALELAAQLQRALESRRTIDQATGLLMARRGYSSEQAFDQLRAISQREHRKLSLVAVELIEDHARRARRAQSADPDEAGRGLEA